MTEAPVIPGLEPVLPLSRTGQDSSPRPLSARPCVYKTQGQDRPRTACKVARAVAELDDEHERLSQMVGQREAWPAMRLSRVLGLMGRPVSASQIRNHRRGECVCQEEANAA